MWCEGRQCTQHVTMQCDVHTIQRTRGGNVFMVADRRASKQKSLSSGCVGPTASAPWLSIHLVNTDPRLTNHIETRDIK